MRAEIGHPLRLRRHRRVGWLRRELVIRDEEIADAVERARRLVGLPAHLLDADPTHLPRGQRKLAAIAGALALEPAVLVLDEPRVSLDAPARSALRHLLHRLRERGTAVVIVEHDLDLWPRRGRGHPGRAGPRRRQRQPARGVRASAASRSWPGARVPPREEAAGCRPD